MPARVAARPRDERGYPVLAITPWSDGRPDFAVTSTARILVCAVERRCSICGTPLDKGPIWRVVAAPEAVEIGGALAERRLYANAAATVEPPGHRECMLYAAMVCPYLARPTARRGQDVSMPDSQFARGDIHGELDGIAGAAVAFDSYEFHASDFVRFRFHGLGRYLPYRLGDELIAELRDAIAAQFAVPVRPSVPWLLADESAAEARAAGYSS
jgi:hypothetical protein